MADISPIGVLSFPHLFKARAPAPGADPRFSVNLIFTEDAQKTDAYKLLRQRIVEAAREKWGAKADEMFQKGTLRSPLRDASEKDYSGYDAPGAKYANFWSKQPPGVVDGRLEDVIDPSYVYPGCLGRVNYNAFAYDTSGNKGVALGLVHMQITDVTTPRLDGRVAANKAFDPVGDGGSGAATGTDDDLPF